MSRVLQVFIALSMLVAIPATSGAAGKDDPAASAAAALHVARIKDLTTIEGIRDNQLIGYGLVVGLAGTGTSSRRFSRYRHWRTCCRGWASTSSRS